MESKRPVPLLARLTLRAKVTLLLVSLSLTPVLVAGIVKVNRAKAHGERTEEVRFKVAAAAAARAMGDLADRALREARLLARRFPVEVDLERAAAVPPEGPALIGWEAAGLIHELSDSEQTTFVAFADGRLAYTVPYRHVSGLDLNRTDWFAGMPAEGGVIAGELVPLTTAHHPALIALAPIRTGARLVGYVGIVLHASRLTDLTHQAAHDIEGVVEVFDAHGRVVTNATHGSNPRSGEPGEPPPRLFDPDAPDGAVTAEYAERQWVVAWASVASVPLKVQLRLPADVAYQHVYVLIWLLVGVIVLTFFFVMLFADYLASVLLRPIHELERGAEMIGAGVLDFRIQVTDHAHDELGRLAGAFNRMGDNLQGSQKQVRAYSRSLETANEELDALVHGLTHDLKKSLRSIQACATFLEEDHAEGLGADGLGLAHSIVHSVERLDLFTDHLIQLVERERVRGEASRFPLRAVVEEARDRVLERVPGEVHIEDPLPEIHADRLQLVMLFDNLIDNGLKFNRNVPAVVRVRCLDEGPDWRIEVEDNGIGIEARYHQQVFELFRRLNHQDDFPGAGTGLNLVRRIVEDHRGTITVQSAPDEGCRIVIYLPKEPMLLTLPGIRI